MSILIKGMDKPTDCGVCPFEDFGYCNVKGERNTSESGVDADCPLVEIKDMTDEEFDTILARLMADRKTEPSNSEKPNNCEDAYPCDTCRHNKLEWYSEICDSCCGNNNHYEPKDEPQTETPTNSEKVQLKVQLTDEPQTERSE